MEFKILCIFYYVKYLHLFGILSLPPFNCNRMPQYLGAFCRRGAPPRGRNPPRFLRQKNWWWQDRGHPDRHLTDVPNHDVYNLLLLHRHRHPRRTTPRRTQRYVYTALFSRSPFLSIRAPLVYVAEVAAGFQEKLCKVFRKFHPGIFLNSSFYRYHFQLVFYDYSLARIKYIFIPSASYFTFAVTLCNINLIYNFCYYAYTPYCLVLDYV